MPDTLTIDMFAPRLGETFRLRLQAEHTIDLELIQVTPLRVKTADGRDASRPREPFAILFRGPADRVVPQQIYPVEHDVMGSHQIFLVPIGPDHAGMRYEAIFT